MKYGIIVKNKKKLTTIKWAKYKPIKYNCTYFIDFEDNEKSKVSFRPTELGFFDGIKYSKMNEYISSEESISFFKSLVKSDDMLKLMLIKQTSINWERLFNELKENQYW
jgi:hypothetical protein